MACKVMNVIAFVLCALSVLLALFSLEPKTMGGFMKVSPRDTANGEQAYLLHPFYVSYTKKTDGTKTEDTDCSAWSEAGVPGGAAGSGIGLTEDNQCYAHLLRATQQPLSMQRYYSAILLGSGIASDTSGNGNCGIRKWWANGIVSNQDIIQQTGSGASDIFDLAGGNSQNQGEIDNVNQMLDTVFLLAQGAGAFLALGLSFNLLALLMGGFIWKFSNGCNYGICAFIFNSTVLASFSTLFYILALGCFAAVYTQGQYIDSDTTCNVARTGGTNLTESLMKANYSPGGALVICAVVFEVIAIILAAVQWMQDKKAQEKDDAQVQVQNVNPGI